MKQLTDFPGYAAAVEKLNEVKAKHAAAIAERDALLSTIEGARDKTESLADQAQRLLSGADTAGVDLGSLRERYSKACRQVGLWGEVVRLAQQKADIERGKASEVICAAARPKFSALVLAELKAAHALLAAQDARRTFWQTLNDAGVLMGHLPATAPLVKGDLRDPSSMFYQRVADAVELGYIAPETFATPEAKPERMGVGRHVSAGPQGVREVTVTGDGTVRPGAWLYQPQPAAAWGDA